MKDSDGKFSDEMTSKKTCQKCSKHLVYKEWDSSCGGYTDYKYRCLTPGCNVSFWVEGADS